MESGNPLELGDPRNGMILKVTEKVPLCVGQPRTGRRKQSQQNIFQDSKNVEVRVLGLESTGSIFMNYLFLNLKTVNFLLTGKAVRGTTRNM